LLVQYTASLLGAVLLAIASQTLTPPAKLPDLFTLLITTYSCLHFIAFALTFHYLQYMA
jgi:alpha-1,3-glucosyltransferase